MNINTSSLLSFLKPGLNDAISNKVNSLSKDGSVEISTLLKDKNIQTLISSLFKDILLGQKTKPNVSASLKNSKELFDFKNTSSDLKDILSQIKNNPKLTKQSNILKNFLTNINDISDKNLKSNLNNSGVFLESKLLKSSDSISTDLKAMLLQVQEHINDPKIQKVISQIEFNQLLSYSSYSFNTFLPFVWDNIEDGSVNITSKTENMIFCSIELSLKNNGKIKSMLLLEDKNNITINLRIENESFKNKIKNNLKDLRKQINKLDLNLMSINILDLNEENTYEENAYKNTQKLDLGIDIVV